MAQTPFKILFKIRTDFPLEIGFVDAVRGPMPRDFFEAQIAKCGDGLPMPVRSYEAYCMTRAAYRYPKHMGYMAVRKPRDDMFSVIVTDGHHLFYADWEGLYEGMVLRLASIMKVNDVRELPIFPRAPSSETKLVFPSQFIIHDTVSGDAGLMTWADRRLLMGGLDKICPIYPPADGDE